MDEAPEQKCKSSPARTDQTNDEGVIDATTSPKTPFPERARSGKDLRDQGKSRRKRLLSR